MHPANRAFAISLQVEQTDTALASSEEVIRLFVGEEQRVRRYEGFCGW